MSISIGMFAKIFLLSCILVLEVSATSNSTYSNPILPGFHPDPSCVFVPELDNTFFCASSSFLVFPGIPIHASQDLQTWKLVSNALNRPEQLPVLSTVKRATSGIWAPTLRYRKGKFYLTTTLVFDDFPKNSTTRFDNFVITTRDPYKNSAWSQPVHFNFTGYDTSPFWDSDTDDDNVIITGTHAWEVSPGIQRIPVNLKTGKVGAELNIWNGTGESAPEGPHIYKKDGWYYLLIAEGGTGAGHRVTMGRSKAIDGPYAGAPHNPVLTNANTSSYFQNVGHADLFQDGAGKWWAVALSVRQGPDGSYPMGRETSLTPVTWNKGEWPIFTPVNGHMNGWSMPRLSAVTYGEGSPITTTTPVVETFRTSPLPPEFVHWRLPTPGSYTPSAQGLELVSSAANLTGADGRSAEPRGQTLIARRQVDSRFVFTATLDARGVRADGHEVGVTVFLDQLHHYDLGLVQLGGRPAFRLRGITTVPAFVSPTLALVPVPAAWLGAELVFEVRASNVTHYSLAVGPVGSESQRLTVGYVPGLGLTWGFTGALLGVYATTNGEAGACKTWIREWRYEGLGQVVD